MNGFLEDADEVIMEKSEEISKWIQIMFGIICFRVAKICFLVSAAMVLVWMSMILRSISGFFAALLLIIIVPDFFANSFFAFFSYLKEKMHPANSDNPGKNTLRILLKKVRVGSLLDAFIIVVLIFLLRPPVLVIVAIMLKYLGELAGLYMISCTPLPAQKSKAREFLESLVPAPEPVPIKMEG